MKQTSLAPDDAPILAIRGAREHNLRGINLDLPKGKLIVFTGVSGSGKSSLAFDTLYAEGQRRYVESLSSYARQFLGQLPKPDVDLLAGLSPSISIQQKAASRNPRSTVGTITEIHDFLRVLFARVGDGYCPTCNKPIAGQGREQILARVESLPHGTPVLILAPLVKGQKGEFKDLFEDLRKKGYLRVRIDGEVSRLEEDPRLDRRIKHHIEVVVDRLRVQPSDRSRLAEAMEAALGLGKGEMVVSVLPEDSSRPASASREKPTEDMLFSSNHACSSCGVSYAEPTPQMFSFNSPAGMCRDCDGLGKRHAFDPELLVPDESLSLRTGAIAILGKLTAMGRWRRHIYEGVATSLGINLKTPWKDLPTEHRNWILHGSGDRHITYEWKQRGGTVWKHGGTWEGVIPQLMAGFRKVASGPRRMQLEKYMRVRHCDTCSGARLNAQARAARVANITLPDLESWPMSQVSAWLEPERGGMSQNLDLRRRTIASELIKEIRGRVQFLMDVGLHYLTLERSAPTLSGGEAQRIRLAGQIGCGLVGVLYILDEPSIGLHPRDNDRLIQSLLRLRDLGNTVIVVEHDEDTMRAADWVVDFGPGPGIRGGQVVAEGPLPSILNHPDSLTAQYLSGRMVIPIPPERRPGNGHAITIRGARHHNLKNINARFPLGTFLCVTGASGSGKSSLVNDILRNALAATDADAEGEEGSATKDRAGLHDTIEGTDHIDKVICIDQSPIGRTPRSNPATYIKLFDQIREMFALTTEAKARGFTAGRFSFNRPGGRCESCEGNGSTKLEMDFLADVWLKCPVCEGKRYNHETLQVKFKGKSIHDILEMDVATALAHFESVPKARTILATLAAVGLDYIHLGQPAPTLSGGEAQRVKLARELSRRDTGRTLYILDEPTTGLHFEDIRKLLEVLQRLVDAGNTVVVIEHNLDVIKTADWIIDMGPDGGGGGGEIVVEGTPETVSRHPESHTGMALAPVLGIRRPAKKGKQALAKNRAKVIAEPMDRLVVRGASQHNLAHLDLEIPRGKTSVFCGPSGSGKSSLALDTIYAEGQRRYMESLSSYARQFLGQVGKPRFDQITGLSPAISIEQKTTSRSPRSTVATVTEIHDYLRVLYSRLGTLHCPRCQVPVGARSTDEIIAAVQAMPPDSRIYIASPIDRRGQETHQELLDSLRRDGYTRVRIDGVTCSIDEAPAIDHRRKHAIEVVVDRLVIRSAQRSRMADSIEKALGLGKGVMRVIRVDDRIPETSWLVEQYSRILSCPQCGRGYERLNPHHFSFNSPLGWCQSCEGLGVQKGTQTNLVFRDRGSSLADGALAAWPDLKEDPAFESMAQSLARHGGFDLNTPWEDLSNSAKIMVIDGCGEEWIEASGILAGAQFQYRGLNPAMAQLARSSPAVRERLDALVGEVPCGACRGARLRPEPAACRLSLGATSFNMAELQNLELAKSLAIFTEYATSGNHPAVASDLVREITNRLGFLVSTGLHYLSLDRPAPTLSGGESQRIRLASQIGSGLTGVLYVLDEPTIGLHPRDNRLLLDALRHLRDLGNTLIIVEHEREVILDADYLVDFGPGAGKEGGQIVAAGIPAAMLKSGVSPTGQYLTGDKALPVPATRRHTSPLRTLAIVGARQNNLKNIRLAIPLGCFVAVTGVSGSGKSSLVNEVLRDTLLRRLHRAITPAASVDNILGCEHIDKVIDVGQDPIGNSPLSNAATYTGLFDLIRELFAKMPESRVRGWQPRRFSFNKPGGRCETCEGNGQRKIEMHFLPDVWVECEACCGKRFNAETLAVKYKGKSISDVLSMRVDEALEFFGSIPKVRRAVQTLADVGLGYLELGQPAPTLSGGEAQRVKLATELARPSTGKTLYILDEPTTGLHFSDIEKLLFVLHRLVDQGNTVLVVEHNLDVIKNADWVIDLGPEAGPGGGTVVAQGSPESIVAKRWTELDPAETKPTKLVESHTARYLGPVLKAGPHRERLKTEQPPLELVHETESEIIGADAPMPWKVDGRTWHLKDRLTADGKPCRWEGEILAHLESLCAAIKGLAPLDWNERQVVEITAPGKPDSWFCHAMTGMEWLVKLVFRVGRGTFDASELETKLGITPLNKTEGLQIYGNEPRVRVAAMKTQPWQSVTLLVHRMSEVNTPAFRSFLEQAAKSYLAQLDKLREKPEVLMPWKLMGEAWHTNAKGFPIGAPRQWDASLLPAIMTLLREAVPSLDFEFDSRDTITGRIPGRRRIWLTLKTKDPSGLECRLAGAKGGLNLGHLAGLGSEREISSDREVDDICRLVFQRPSDLDAPLFRALLVRHAASAVDKASV